MPHSIHLKKSIVKETLVQKRQNLLGPTAGITALLKIIRPPFSELAFPIIRDPPRFHTWQPFYGFQKPTRTAPPCFGVHGVSSRRHPVLDFMKRLGIIRPVRLRFCCLTIIGRFHQTHHQELYIPIKELFFIWYCQATQRFGRPASRQSKQNPEVSW